MTVLFAFLVTFFVAFLAQKLIYPVNMWFNHRHKKRKDYVFSFRFLWLWFNFVFGSFFEQDHLLNLTILGGYAKTWRKCARVSKQQLMQLKISSMVFFQLWLSEDLSIGKILSQKKKGGWWYGVNFRKEEKLCSRT